MALSNQFIEKYKTRIPPFGGNGLGETVYLRTYSRWLPQQNRREQWYETVRRVVDYSVSLYNDGQDHTSEAEELYDLIFNLKVFPAGRTLWIGGTEAVKKFPMANYNCSFRVINDLSSFDEIFYLLMLGCGTGFRILPEDVAEIPALRADVELEFETEPHKPLSGYNVATIERTFAEWDKDKSREITIVVGDSKEGWVEALQKYLNILEQRIYDKVIINTHYVRPKGAVLKTFGGRASGPEGLIQMFKDIHSVIANAKQSAYIWNERAEIEIAKLLPIDALDILNIIAYNVVVGGVRRSSQIALFGQDDKDVLNAKLDLYTPGSANYGKNWRAMSNNSIYFTDRPSKAELKDIFTRIQHNGEPGFVNSVAASERRPNFNGINPCAEILLDNRGLCNLSEINLTAFVIETNGKKHLDFRALETAIKHAVLMGLRITTVDLELPEWDKVQKRDRLIGVSLSGIMETEDLVGTIDFESINSWANYYATKYAKEMRIPAPLLVTTVKPSGTLSQLPTISSGIHRPFSRFYTRRVRITSSDPLAYVLLDAGYPVYPEVGMGPLPQEFDKLNWYDRFNVLQEANTWVVEFPVKTNAKVDADEEPAIVQYNRYLKMQELYTDHNTSITIYFKKDEVDLLIDRIWETWDEYIAVSFLPTDENTYTLMPYEKITETEYNQRNRFIDPKGIVENLYKRESQELLDAELDPSCATGICPPR